VTSDRKVTDDRVTGY